MGALSESWRKDGRETQRHQREFDSRLARIFPRNSRAKDGGERRIGPISAGWRRDRVASFLNDTIKRDDPGNKPARWSASAGLQSPNLRNFGCAGRLGRSFLDFAKKKFSARNLETIQTPAPDDTFATLIKGGVKGGSLRARSHFRAYLLRGPGGAFPRNGSRSGPFLCQRSPGGRGSSRV